MKQSKDIFDRILLIVSISIFISFNINAQVLPEACLDPANNGPGCFCSTAGILCTPDELDGFAFNMSSVSNLGDLPQNDLCPGLPDGGTGHNVNFFAFIVWCETLTFNVLVSNCVDFPGPPVSYGIQMALFANCGSGNSGWDPVECITNGGDTCYPNEAAVPAVQTFSASGLEIGGTYYFMVDGCGRSTCKVTIDVQGVCGTGEIDAWGAGITGPLNVCVGDTETYTTEDLNGAEEYYYYLNGTLIDDGEELLTTDVTFPTVGSYLLCVDVSNLPCVPESAFPPQNCITIIATDPGDGNIVANPAILCPDEVSTISVNNNNTDPLLSQYIVIVGPDGLVVQVVQGLTTTLTYDMCGEFTAYFYSFVTSDNPTLPVVGNTWTLPNCVAECCYLDDVDISFEDDVDPVFTNAPPDITIDCAADILPDEEVTWTDNCAGTGTVLPTVVENYTFCDGGTVDRTWTFTDSCANTVDYTQTLTIDPIPIAVFVSPPADSTIDCAMAQMFVPLDVNYNNFGTGACNIMGTITNPTSTGTFDLCGSSKTFTWTFTDVCNRTISYSQVVTVEEVGAANEFVNPPNDTTVTCMQWLAFTPAILTYSNGLNAPCQISGSVAATTSDVHDPCGSTITYFWEFTDVCNRTITHTQVVTIQPMLAANYVNPPGNITINCDALQTFAPAVLTYTNGGSGACLIQGTVNAVGNGTLDTCGNSVTYTWDYTDICGRPLTHSQIVTVDPIPQASFVNPPGNVSIDCNELQTFTPAVLFYTNGGSGNCLIEGTIDAVGDGTLDICGNSVNYFWEFTDQCGRTITHNQTVTVAPIALANFVNPPGNVTISCDELQTFTPAILTYTNGGSGNCLITGTANPSGNGTLDICGNSVTYSWNFTDQCGRPISHSQTVTVAPIPEASYVNPPASVTITCDELQTFTPAILAYTNGGSGNCLISGTVDPVGDGPLDICGSTVNYTWDFTDQCGRLISHAQTVTVAPIPEASYVNPPANVTITCDELQTFVPAILAYTNGGSGACLISGTVDPVGDGTLDICGNSVNYTWEFTDQCGRLISHSQTVTVAPIPEASYVNPPANVTITCDQLQTFTPAVLNYTNGGSGACLISGTVDPVGDGPLDICGSTVTYLWEFTDQCGRLISHTQTVTVTPIPVALYVNPPGNVTITCDQLQTFTPAVLNYTNGGSGACLISGTVDPVGDGPLDICGSTVIYLWEFTDQCGRLISHSQTVTVTPIPAAAFVNPPASVTITCDDLLAFTPVVLSYTNGGTAGCLISGTVDPVGDGTLDICGNSVNYLWEFTDQCGRLISHTQTVTVLPIPEATFFDIPGDITLNCDDLLAFTPAVLSYTNGGVGGCLIEGTVDPVGDGTLDKCGNTVTFTWDFTDDCGRPISHTQTVTVEPIAPPAFIAPPGNMTVMCGSNPNEGDGPDLSYTNGGVDDCETAGSVSPTEVFNVNECGGSIVYNWTFTDDCGNTINHSQTITVQPAPKAQLQNLPPSSITIQCNENTGSGPDLLVTNNGTGVCLIEETISPVVVGNADICGGAFQFLWEFTDACGRITSFLQTVNVNPAPVATFDNIPIAINIECSENADDPGNLSYSNGETGNCEISGEVPGVRSGSLTYCGGVLLDKWEFTDECGRYITTERNVTVAPAPPAAFINPLGDINIACGSVNTIPTTLNFSNGETGICLISGVRTAVVSGSYNSCGGMLIYTWSFVDNCGRSISHSRNITVNPAIEPVFIDPPVDITLSCAETYPGAANLNYSNGVNAPCSITGVVIPTSVQVNNIITNTWELILPCSGEILEHTQTVTLSIIPNITVSPSSVFLCQGEDYDLADIIVTDLNGTALSLTYHNAFPPTAGNEIPSIVNTNSDFIYVINATNEFGCADYELINIFVELPPFAGNDQSTTVCSGGIPLNLYNYVPPFADQGGTWLDIDGIGANISNPNGATFNNVAPGNYNLYYVVFSTTVCDNDTMVLNIEVIDNVTFEIIDVNCIGNNDFYEVYVNSNGFVIQSTAGNVVNISGDDYVVTNIPITTGVFISAFEIVSGCSTTEFIDIPNCDCPDIAPPTTGNISICVDEQPIVITVTVPAGMTANWFYTQNSNNPFLAGSTQFTLQDSSVGVYSFFVESYDPATDCASNVKLKIDVEINNLPLVMDASIEICDIGNDGSQTVLLQSFNALINGVSANSFSYYASLADAESETNQLSNSLILSLGSMIVYVKVENSANCSSIAQLELILNDLPLATVETTAPSCLGDNDGLIEITATDVDGAMTTSLDGITFSPTNFYSGLPSGLYTVYIRDENGCTNTYNVTIDEGLNLLFTIFTAVCNDNGTNSDPDDDFYTITMFVENNRNNAGTYYVIFNGSVQYTFNYGSSQSFTIPVDEGNSIIIAVTDFEFLCSKEKTFGPLNPCSTNCEISIDNLAIECKDNNTDTNPADDYYIVTINASALNGSLNNTYNVFLDGVLLYNFTYGVDETFQIAANGNILNITCQDNEDVQCQTTQDIGPLMPCSDECQIELDVVSIVCSNNGTSSNQNDDFYTITINGTIINGNTLTEFELFVDGVSQGLFNYGDDVSFDIPADQLTHIIGIVDGSNSSCEDSFTTNVLTNCSTDCEIIQNTMVEACFDNGTPEDSTDDYYEITFNLSSINGATNQFFNLYIDGAFDGAYAYNADITITILANNMIHTLLFQDSEKLVCQLEVQTSTLTSCSGACLVELSIDNFTCFNNNTGTILDDDYYVFDLTGVLLNGDGNSSYELYVDGVLHNTYSYGELVNVTLPADNAIHTFLIIDTMDSDCTYEIQTNTLISCSTGCEIVVNEILYACFDNNTPTDPSDDIIGISINVSAINGATNNKYNLYFNGALKGIYTYGTTQLFNVPANGQSITFRFQDSQKLQCELIMQSELLSPCSDGCLIDLNVLNIQCFNNGTPTDVDDDYYEISIEGEILNGTPFTTFEVFVDNVSQGSSNYGVAYVVTIPADNLTHIINIVDGGDPTCTSTYTTDILSSCSTDCEIFLDAFTFVCFDNGTLSDPSDDYYEINLNASTINGSNGFVLTISGVSQGNFNYGQNVKLTVPANGANLILVLTDLNDIQCKINQAAGPLISCSDLCLIEPMIMESLCFDNGTPLDPTDDYWEITVFVNPANGLTAPTFDLTVDGTLNGTYPYSQNVVITIPANNATHLINVNDSDDLNCVASVGTQVLGYCSTPCDIEGTYSNVICDNNGTNNTDDDDFFYVDLLVSNPTAGQFDIPSLSIGGNYNQSINLGPFNISNGSFTLEIIDEDQNLCLIQVVVIPPAPCSDCAQTVDAGMGGTISCDITEINLLGTSSETGIYSWYGPAGNLVSQALSAKAVSVGIYTFSVMFDDGCVAEDHVEILADTDLPMASLTSNGPITCLKEFTILDGSASGSSSEFFFYWFDANGNLLSDDQTYEASMAGVYFLQVESITNNCKSALLPVVVNALLDEPSAIIYAEPSSVIDCVIKSIVLSTDEEVNVNYVWSINGLAINNTSEIEITDIGTYGLMAIDTITGCVGIADLIISSLVEYPNINLAVPQVLDCDNELAIIVATSIHSGSNTTSYWEDINQNILAENQDTLEVTEPGEYFYTLIDNNNGCENTDTISVILFVNDVEIVTIPEVTYTEGESVILSATVNLNNSEIESIQWTPDENMSCSTCLTTQINNPTDSIYFIEVIDIYGCTDIAMVRLIRKERPKVFIPNVLNINSNSGNDKFKIYGNEEVVGILKMQIYDRWGNLVYLSKEDALNTGAGWDGTFNGKDVEQGVYVYILEVLLKDGSSKLYYGDLSVIR